MLLPGGASQSRGRRRTVSVCPPRRPRASRQPLRDPGERSIRLAEGDAASLAVIEGDVIGEVERAGKVAGVAVSSCIENAASTRPSGGVS
jgi:hypothetical protein